MFRTITPAHTDHLRALTAKPGLFQPIELTALREVLDDYHTTNADHGHRGFAWEEDGRLLGYAYYAPTPMTDRTWHLFWIAVDSTLQGRGLGGKLLRFV